MTESTALPQIEWPYLQILLRLGLSLALGLLIGLERERRGKEAGLRTFGFICLLGALGGSMGTAFGLLILALVGVLMVLLNLQTLRAGQGTELTTSAAMLVTAVAGMLCGQGHTVTPAAVMVLATALLAWKERLAGFSMGLSEGELRSALLLAILAIVIYPALPAGAVGPWHLIEPREAWVTVILIAGIGSVNYVLWKIYGDRGIEISGFLGGLINSNFTVIELSSYVRQGADQLVNAAYRGIVLATSAMIVRNASLLLILAPQALLGSLGAFGLMLAVSASLALWSLRQRRHEARSDSPDMAHDLPFSLPQALRYGLLFLVLHVLGALAQHAFGNAGFYVVSVVGGLMSSASAVAAAAALQAQGSLDGTVAGTGAVLASFTSIAFSLSFVLRTRNAALIRRLARTMAAVALAGGLGVLINQQARPWLAPWLSEQAAPVLALPGSAPRPAP